MFNVKSNEIKRLLKDKYDITEINYEYITETQKEEYIKKY